MSALEGRVSYSKVLYKWIIVYLANFIGSVFIAYLILASGLWKGGDQAVIDGVAVNGSAWLVDRIAGVVRHVQSGYLYHYAFAMILGLIFMLAALIRVQG